MRWWCKGCRTYHELINAGIGGVQWARVEGKPDAIKEAEKRLARYRTGWDKHLADAHGSDE